jgi:ubiquinone/menaquinone biosynthesis C-methylase UbiE
MKSNYWKDHWENSAKDNKDIRLISGWGNRSVEEILFAIRDIAIKLNLRKNDILLDAGCGGGLFEIALSPWIKKIYAFDFSQKMVNIAKRNTRKYKNVTLKVGNIRKMPFDMGLFNKVLLSSVIQYLNNMDEVESVISDLYSSTSNDVTILISMTPDADNKHTYIEGYYKLGLTEVVIQKKIESLNKSIWFDRYKLKELCEKSGFKATILDIDEEIWQSKYYFDLLLKKGGGK